jgi:hypothetical protein
MGVEAIESVELTAQPAAVVRDHVTRSDLPQFLGDAFEETMNAITDQGRATAGPPFARYGWTVTASPWRPASPRAVLSNRQAG